MKASDLSKLGAFFTPDDLEWKPIAISKKTNKGLAAAYVTNRAIQQRLDNVCGPADWRNDYRPGPIGGILCGISIRIDREDGSSDWVTKWDGADNTDIEAVKGGLSNSMKRAASQWGVGRYLYDIPSQWVPVDEHGRFAQEPRLPREFLPAERPAPQRREAPPRDERPSMGDGFDRPARPAAR